MTNAVSRVEGNSAVAETASIISVIEQAAANPQIDVEKMSRLLDMQERILDRNAKQAFAAAMNKVQAVIQPVVTDENNTQTKSRYATYEALDHIVRPIYTQHGFSPTFGTADSSKESTVRVTCDLLHSAGHEKHYFIDIPADGKGAKGGDVMTKTHATGAAMSYGKRYLLTAMFNIAIKDEDDDGNGASDPPVTEDQMALLRKRLDSVSADIPAFCRYMEVGSLAEIPQSKLKAAHDALTKKGAPK